MDNERYEAQLDLDIKPFENAVKDAQAVWKQLGVQLEKSASASEWFNKVSEDAEKMGNELDAVKHELEELQKQLDSGHSFSSTLGVSTNKPMVDALKLMGEYLADAGKEAENTADAVKDIGEASEDSKDKTNDLTGIFKKMGLAVLGVRSSFTFFRKVVSTALSNNIELSNKFQSVWNALGNAVTPILERIVNWLILAIGYLNIFVKAVSGGKIDLFAKSAKSAGSTAKSVKEASKYLASFDELQNVDEGTSGGGGGGGIGGIADPFKDLNLNTEWAEKIQKFGEWVRQYWPLVLTLLGTTVLVMKGFNAGSMSAFGFALLGVYEIFQGIADIMNGDVKKGLEEIVIGIGLVVTAFTIMTGTFSLGLGALIALIVYFAVQVIRNWDNIKAGAISAWENIKQKTSDIVTGIKNWVASAVDNITAKVSTFKTNVVNKLTDIKNGAKNIINGIIGFFEGMANAGIRAVNKVIQGLNRFKISIPSWVPTIGGKSFGFNLGQVGEISLARLDSGTNYVPNDQLAMIHKGEAVIPKKFNSEEYFNNEATVEKLDRVIDLLENIDFQPYITVKDIGSTATKYQAQQVRIMGGKL